MATERYRERRRTGAPSAAPILELLAARVARAAVLEVRQYLAPERGEVVYRHGPARRATRGARVVFALDGRLVRDGRGHGARATAGTERGLAPLGRMFVASRAGRAAGFVVEGEARGYKNRIRFFVGARLRASTIAGVRVVEHEEDPGLGAEVATPCVPGPVPGPRPPPGFAALDVTRDPMPEDWRAALATLERAPAREWRERHAALIARERARPIYAVTGATISSRALTDGVRDTVDHFRRRWQLLAPHLGGAS